MTSVTERCRQMLRSGATVDDILGIMRREGESRIASIAVLMELTGMSLREAKIAVHTSSVWGDLRNETEVFHERLEQAAEDGHDGKEPK
jgi:hypothetical protein